MRKRLVLGVVTVLVVFVLIGVSFLIDLARFPGPVKPTNYTAATDGIKSTFHRGVMYRYPEVVPLLEVSGDHYEMGLQYGVLLRREIVRSLESYEKIIRWHAERTGVPRLLLTAGLKCAARKLSRRLPDRFLEEIRGVSEGSGVPRDTILAITLFYDVSEGKGCTGVLMRGRDHSIIHGRNNDTSGMGGEELGKLTVVVKKNAEGYNAICHMDYPLYLGVETGYNDKGLAFSEETLHVRHPDPGGFPIIYLARIALEECSSLDELYPLFDRYSVIGAYGTVWSDRNEGRGVVVELTPTGWAATELEKPILWNFNRIYDPELAKQQRPYRGMVGSNSDRERITSAFPSKTEYEIEDTVTFLRLQEGPDGTDYSWCGTRWPICNWSGQQMMVFHPTGDGFYLAVGTYYAARQSIYHIHEDFSRPPELFMTGVPLEPLVEEVAKIENSLVSAGKKLQAFVELAKRYRDDANVQFIVAYYSFQQSRWDLFAEYAEKAYLMKPSVAEYKLYAGMAAYQQRQPEKAIAILEEIESADLHPAQEIYRLFVLERALASIDPERSAQYKTLKEAILNGHDAGSYFESSVLPLLNGLETTE